jgi:hypothetical protein
LFTGVSKGVVSELTAAWELPPDIATEGVPAPLTRGAVFARY